MRRKEHNADHYPLPIGRMVSGVGVIPNIGRRRPNDKEAIEIETNKGRREDGMGVERKNDFNIRLI